MKTLTRAIPAVFLLILTTTSHAAKWKADVAHSSVSFTVKHMMLLDVRGNFNDFDATVDFDESTPATFAVDATAQTASIDTRNDRRDGHLKSPDFFDAETFPALTFKSTKVEKVGDGHYAMIGDLTMHGVTKPVTFDVKGFTGFIDDSKGGRHTAATATATIDRTEFGLVWNRPVEGGVLVDNDVNIEIQMELIKQQDN
jgi:polyisoprenoid-binding protein YceI